MAIYLSCRDKPKKHPFVARKEWNKISLGKQPSTGKTSVSLLLVRKNSEGYQDKISVFSPHFNAFSDRWWSGRFGSLSSAIFSCLNSRSLIHRCTSLMCSDFQLWRLASLPLLHWLVRSVIWLLKKFKEICIEATPIARNRYLTDYIDPSIVIGIFKKSQRFEALSSHAISEVGVKSGVVVVVEEL